MTTLELSAGVINLTLFDTCEVSGVVTRCEEPLDEVDEMLDSGFDPNNPEHMQAFADTIRETFTEAPYCDGDPEEVTIGKLNRSAVDYKIVANVLVQLAMLRRMDPDAYEAFMHMATTKMTRTAKRILAEKQNSQ